MKRKIRIKDYMRGDSDSEVIIRFNPEDAVELPCHCDYDPALSGKEGEKNKVLLVRNIEAQNSDGSWSPYPSVTWIDGGPDEMDETLITLAFIKKTGEDSCSIMHSAQGVPDSILMLAAEEAGVYVLTIG